MSLLENIEVVEVLSRQAWRDWLESNHNQSEIIWLVTYKKHTDHYLAYDDIVEEALCFGWIDSLPRQLDEDRTMLLLNPPAANSKNSNAGGSKYQSKVGSF